MRPHASNLRIALEQAFAAAVAAKLSISHALMIAIIVMLLAVYNALQKSVTQQQQQVQLVDRAAVDFLAELLPLSYAARALLAMLLALVLALALVGAVAVFQAARKARQQSNRARREARRLASKPRDVARTNSSISLIVDKRLRPEFLMDPAKNADWKVVHLEDFSYVPIPEDWDDGLAALQDRVGVRFKDARHLKCALVHHSVLSGGIAHQHLPDSIPLHRLSNRSMEFLGDSVLAVAVASYIFQAQPEHQEGQMTRVKDMLVNNRTLSRVCVDALAMDGLVIVDPTLSAGQKDNTSPSYLKSRVTVEAGAVEALIAAIYLDQGLECALAFVNRHVLPHAIRYAAREAVWDPAMELQRLLQAHGMGHPTYENVPTPTRTGNEERDVHLIVQGQRVLTATSSSYKTARRQVAEDGYQHYIKLLGPLPPS